VAAPAAADMSVLGATPSVFKSSSSRFAKGTSNPHVHHVGDCATLSDGESYVLTARDAVAGKPGASRQKIASLPPL
jgi:hypothetical protein